MDKFDKFVVGGIEFAYWAAWVIKILMDGFDYGFGSLIIIQAIAITIIGICGFILLYIVGDNKRKEETFDQDRGL